MFNVTVGERDDRRGLQTGPNSGHEKSVVGRGSGLNDTNISDDTWIGKNYDVEKVFITIWLFNKLLKIEGGKNIV